MIGWNARTLALVAAIGSATTGGVFSGFSTFVMPALRRLSDVEGIRAMQAINKAAPSPLFMLAFVGSAALSVAAAIVALQRHDHPTSTYLLVGSGLYLAGFVLTAAYHIPRNDALMALDPTSAGAAAAWRRYASEWTRWNHARALTSLAGAVSFVLAFRAA